MNRPDEIVRRKHADRDAWIVTAILFVLAFLFLKAIEKTPEEKDRDWQKTLKETEAYEDRKAKEKDEQWKAKNREELARWIRNHPNGR